MIVYPSSKMTGTDDNGARQFADATAALRAKGHVVVSPGELNDLFGERDYAQCLKLDLLLILSQVEALVMLPGWHRSLGARVEHDVASAIGLPIFYGVESVPHAEGVPAPRARKVAA